MASSNASNDFSLQGKSALVVGADHSVGRAAAVALAEAGARVVLASQEPGTDKQLKEVAKLVNAAGTNPVIRVQDAATRADLSATADLAAKELGGSTSSSTRSTRRPTDRRKPATTRRSTKLWRTI